MASHMGGTIKIGPMPENWITEWTLMPCDAKGRQDCMSFVLPYMVPAMSQFVFSLVLQFLLELACHAKGYMCVLLNHSFSNPMCIVHSLLIN